MDYKILINREHLLFEHQVTGRRLMIVRAIDQEDILVDRTTYEAFCRLKKYLKGHQIDLGIDSAYRSFDRQKMLYQEFILKYGKEYADKVVAPVGASEHHSGLAIDFTIKEKEWIMDNTELMKKEETLQKIHDHLATFGFILRYPKGKETVTGYPYEPWHIRYVGKKLAHFFMKHQLTLEEYDQKRENNQ